ELATQFKQGIHTVISGYVSPDDKEVTKQIAQFMQSGLGLPSKDYYTDQDSISKKNRAAYQQYIATILSLTGQDEATATKNAQSIFALENTLANASLRPVEMRDPQRLYNKFNPAAFTAQTPNINWTSFLDKIDMKGQDSFLIATPKYYQELSKQLSATPLEVWKQYLRFHVTSDMAPYLSADFDQARFHIYDATLRGQKEQQARWKRVMGMVNGSIGEQLGQLYVDRFFKPQAKERMKELVNN